MPNQWVDTLSAKHDTHRFALHHITYLLDWTADRTNGGLPRFVLPSGVVGPRSLRSRQHNAIRGYGGPRKESAPPMVVPPADGQNAVTGPVVYPPAFLGARNPGALNAARLVQRNDVAHGGQHSTGLGAGRIGDTHMKVLPGIAAAMADQWGAL